MNMYVLASFTLLLLVLFQVKHWLADYLLQGRYMLGKFRDEGWVGPLLAHASVHGAMTAAIVFWAMDGDWRWTYVLGSTDLVVHFFMDRLKASPRLLGRFKPATAQQLRNSFQVLEDDVVWEAYREAAAEARRTIWHNRLFWLSLGFDQTVHHLTHYGIIFVMLWALAS